jgi:arsenite methyltransferase
MAATPAHDIRYRVREAYSAAANRPEDKHPFPVGRAFAESIGYPAALLDSVPSVCVEGFAGVSNVSLFAEIPQGAVVLDLGCGAGLDSLVAAGRTGLSGKVIGVDFSTAMLDRARQASAEARVENACFEQADAEHLPLATASVDVAVINGIFNLNPARESIFRELARVLRPGGAAYAAELILGSPLPANVKRNESDWFA